MFDPHQSVAEQTQLPGRVFFPESQFLNIRLFYVLTALNNVWFVAGNWIFFWTRFMTFGQLGLVDATAFTFGLLMEIPSGAVSDLIGKKATILFSMFLATVGIFGFATTTTLTQLWISFFIMQLGTAFYSGAAEALAYDTLVEKKREHRFDQVMATNGSVALVTLVTTTLAGGLMYALVCSLFPINPSRMGWHIFDSVFGSISLEGTKN